MHQHVHIQEAHHREFSISIVLNALFVIFQIFYALKANSMSLLADGWHNLSDVLGLGFAWVASYLHTKKGSTQFSYGYKRTTIIASLINALFLVGTCTLIAYEGILKIISPQPLSEITMLLVAGFGIIVNGGTALLFREGSAHDLNLKGAWLHLLSDALISVGVVVTAVIMYFTGWLWLDGLATLIIVAIIVYGTWELLSESLKLLLDAVPATTDLEEIREYLLGIPQVQAVHDLHVWGLSTKETALTAHLVMPNYQVTDALLHQIQHDLKDKYHIHHSTLQFEQGVDEFVCSHADQC